MRTENVNMDQICAQNIYEVSKQCWAQKGKLQVCYGKGICLFGYYPEYLI